MMYSGYKSRQTENLSSKSAWRIYVQLLKASQAKIYDYRAQTLHITPWPPALIWKQPLTKLPHDCVESYRLRAVWKLLSNSSPTRHSPLHSLGATLRYKALLWLVGSLHSSLARPIRLLKTACVEVPVASWGPGNSLSGGFRQGQMSAAMAATHSPNLSVQATQTKPKP